MKIKDYLYNLVQPEVIPGFDGPEWEMPIPVDTEGHDDRKRTEEDRRGAVS
jgi:hypothetical protein